MITTSRLVKKNAVDDVIQSLPLLPDTIKFVILGIGPDENKLKKLAEEQGMVTMQEDGVLKALLGVTSLEEVERLTGEIFWGK